MTVINGGHGPWRAPNRQRRRALERSLTARQKVLEMAEADEDWDLVLWMDERVIDVICGELG